MMMEGGGYFPPLAVQVGLSCLAAQVVLTLVLMALPYSGPWSQLPGVTAHQLVCLPIMMYLAYQGFHVWFLEQDELYAAGMSGRIFGLSPRGQDLGAFVWGMMLFWDIPVSFIVPTLQDTLMLAHHVGMMYVAALSLGFLSTTGHSLGSYYLPFFFGMVEFSTIFLTIVDLFHPKNKTWHTWLNESPSKAANIMRGVNEICRPLFALSYLAMRCVLFPFVMLSTCLPDFWRASLVESDEERQGVGKYTLRSIFLLSLLFTLLQLHWGALVARQVAKALGLLSSEKGKAAKKA